jgi:hypothetical protein
MFGLSVGLGFGLPVVLVNGLADGLTVGLALGLTFGFTRAFGTEPKAIIPRWPRSREFLRPLTFALLFGPLLGAIPGIAVGLTLGSTVGLTIGLTVGIVVGLTGGLLDLWTLPIPSTVASTPILTYHADRRTYFLYGVTFTVAFGPALVITGGFTGELTGGLVGAFTVALLGALNAGSTPMVGLTQLVLATTRAGQVHFMRLLEEAHDQQALRQAGAVYQFRHAELQEYLAEIHRQRTEPSTGT